MLDSVHGGVLEAPGVKTLQPVKADTGLTGYDGEASRVISEKR